MQEIQVGSLLVAVFDDEAAAGAGAGILRELHASGTLTLYALAIVARGPAGAGMFVRVPVDPGGAPAAPAVGATIGALVTLLDGPLAAASRTINSGLVGAVRDLDEAGLDAALLQRISRRFRAGCGAVIAEAEEVRQLPLDARILALRGHVFRHRLQRTLTEERAIRELTALRCELRRLRTEPGNDAYAKAEARVRRDRMLELQRMVESTHALAHGLRSEAAAKVAVLRLQAARFEGAARQAIEERAASVRSDLEARASRLDRIAKSVAPLRSASARPAPGQEGDS
jgi:hypothetical protein